MEEYIRRSMFSLGAFCLVLSLLGVRAQHNQSVPSQHTSAYFNATVASTATISSVLNLKGHTTFSFRTCSKGVLISQTGATGSSLEVSLTEGGSLQLQWRHIVEQTGKVISDVVQLGQNSLRNNQWYTVELKYLQGEINLTVEQGKRMLYRELLANSTFRRYLWNIDLSGPDGLKVGQGYTGCILQGLGVNLSAANASRVLWDTCPLESRRGCDPLRSNPCWSYPCQNDGTCIMNGTTYFCNCPIPYSGKQCETDLGYKGCELHPCRNGGTCETRTNGTRRYICNCPSGFTGVHCEININECETRPCLNSGVCTDQVNGFTCNCTATGFQGDLCETNINECVTLKPCQNGGECSDTPGSFKCRCPPGHAGATCEQAVNECNWNPCFNDGGCIDYLGDYNCTCAEGFTGKNCETNVDECASNPCSDPLRYCEDDINAFICLCRPGYQEVGDTCVDVDECTSIPCLNGATCVNMENQYSCNCSHGYSGTFCEFDINECVNRPCLNGATCNDEVGQFRCDCLPGYTGVDCAIDIKECDSNPCRNHAVCVDEVNRYRCMCDIGFTGAHCETNINECGSAPCLNGAVCMDLRNNYTCECLEGYTGLHCETDIDDCVGSPCQNNATCKDGVADYTCTCTPAWMGKNCSQLYDACSFVPCQNQGRCTSIIGTQSYNCDCLVGFMGADCEINIDYCIGAVCLDYQVCVDQINDFTCECPKGYEGGRCENDINECAGNPCQNGATCLDLVANYTCECVGQWIDLSEYTTDNRTYWVGFSGKNCGHAVNECEYDPPICLNNGLCENTNDTAGFSCYCPNHGGSFVTGPYCEKVKKYCEIVEDQPACYNGGMCESGLDDYKCTCLPGFTGRRCKTNINECASAPCENGGTCIDGINGYECVCQEGISGTNCDINIDECFSNPCLNGGQCLDAINRYTCTCENTGFRGVHCEMNIDDCEPAPCQNGGQCQDAVKNYTCTCFEGYVGHSCEIDINECLSSPCQNNATCSERSDPSKQNFSFGTAAGFDCYCAPGYEGNLCEIDINECASNPCQRGTCEDGVNGYFCHCRPGYRGRNCEEEINECVEWNPCKNGASCLDRINDYSCVCTPMFNGSEFSGRNCTVKLIGCEVNQCHNEANCMPYLFDEVNDIHNYTCQCQPGFTGFYCDFATTASFDGHAWMRHDGQIALGASNMSLRFRTTLPNATLAYMQDEAGSNRLYLVLTESRTLVLYINIGVVEVTTVSLITPSQQNLNDASWHQVAVLFIQNEVQMFLYHPDCGRRPCMTTQDLVHNVGIVLTAVYLGGTLADVMDPGLTAVAKPLIGCLQDVAIDNAMLVPQDMLQNRSENLVLGCLRKEQCVPQPCQNGGVCFDLWDEFQCRCKRPYVGETCNTSIIPATFGFRDSSSFARFEVSGKRRTAMQRKNVISMFFRTRKENGLIVLIGHRVAPTVSYIMAGLEGGYVKVWIKLLWEGGPDVLVIDQQRFDDGQQHFLFINRTEHDLHVKVDNYPEVFKTYTETVLIVSELYVGGLPAGGRRRRRQAPGNNTTIPELGSLKGTLQDVRLNDQLLEFFPVNETGIPTSFSTAVLSEVKQGEVDDDRCSLGHLLCENNGTCRSRFFNDYSCDCPDGFKGKNCSALNFCLYAQCPGNSTCNDLMDGYECVAAATFNGQSSMLRYSTNFNMAATLSNTIQLTMRSRQTDGLLFHARGTEELAEKFITIRLVKEQILVYFILGNVKAGLVSTVTVNDGSWHNVTVSVAEDLVSLRVDDTDAEPLRTSQTVLLSHLLNQTSDIYIGGVSAGYQSTHANMFGEGATFFKGCMDEIRIDRILLPFFSLSEGYNSSVTDQFHVVKKEGLKTGCHGDDVCSAHDCVNGATCMDIWNSYSCQCVLGFNGTLCENNIDDCVQHACENQAICEDAVNNYTCSCLPGFTGLWCQTNIDECMSGPCRNNGTCSDGINGYTCNCTADYIGADCEISVTEKCDNETNYPCVNGTCLTVNTSYPGVVTFECKCLEGYTGRLCETPIDYCAQDPCRNGTCTSHTDLLDYKCTCAPGFEGRNCSEEIDECKSVPCKNNGICTDKLADFDCNCTAGWEGKTCEIDVNECNLTWHNNSPPCERGVCVNTNGSYFCNCTGTGYEGDRCQIEIDECEQNNTCLNGGYCINLNGSYMCNCSLGYEGKRCGMPNCTSEICLYDANCTITDDSKWKCECEEFFEGERCMHRGLCADFPCVHGGTCQQQMNPDKSFNYTCLCSPGWRGKNCTEDVPECENEPCQNGASCNEVPGSFNCTCAPGFTGQLCQDEIDECATEPCLNGGWCIDRINGYECVCEGTGFTGTNCEEDINECNDSKICNDGVCNNFEGTFNCTCFTGYVGHNCHSADPCFNTTYCENDGVCTFLINDTAESVHPECDCLEDFSGVRCEVQTGRVETDGGVPWNIIIGVSACALILIIVIAVIAFLLMARKKRATRGTYSPSWQEMAGSRVEMGNVLKPPPEERLI